MSRPATVALIVALIAWHLFGVLGAWPDAVESTHGRDFATYYYADRAVQLGEDPYDRFQLSRFARDEDTRGTVYPYLYPPTFLLGTGWVRPLPLHAAYLVWFWLDELFLVLAGLALARWWRPLGGGVGVVLIAAIAACTAVPNNHLMGQVNLPVLALALAALWQEDRGRWGLAGLLLGLAVALKLSPVLLVAWWALRGRWRAVGASALTVLLAAGLAAALFGLGPFVVFMTEVIPTFRSGDYNGLGLNVALFGNLSLAKVWDQLLPIRGPTLSPLAQAAVLATSVTVLGGLAWLWRRAPTDPWTRAAQAAGVMVVMLLLPVFTYEHHVVWALPAVVLSALALGRGRLGIAWAPVLGLAWVAWAVDLGTLRELVSSLDGVPVVPAVLEEAKCGALVVLATSMAFLGRGP
jgi:hypothetical protein